MSVSVQYEHLHTILYNPFFIGLLIVVGVRQYEHTVSAMSYHCLLGLAPNSFCLYILTIRKCQEYFTIFSQEIGENRIYLKLFTHRLLWHEYPDMHVFKVGF